jgi:hypothetical protein
VEEFMS